MLNNTRTYSDIWQNCLDQIKARTSAEEFEKWFQPIVPLEFDGTTLRLRVPNESYVRQIEKNYIPFLKPIISQLYGQQTRLHYAVPRTTVQAVPVAADSDTTAISRFNTQTNTANIKNPFVIPGLKKIIIDPQLNPNLTFATFIEGECNRLARSAGMSVAVNPGNNPFNPLYIYGDSGLGKTHIVQSIGHEVRQRHPELQVLYVSMNKFQAQFQTAYKNGEIPDFIHFYQMIDVLIIDDIQNIIGKRASVDYFFQLMDEFIRNNKKVVIAADRAPKDLNMDERLTSRFNAGMLCLVAEPSYEMKYKILQRYYENTIAVSPDADDDSLLAAYGSDCGHLTDEHFKHMAEVSGTNIRELESFCERCAGEAGDREREGGELTFDDIDTIASQYFDTSAKKINVQTVQSVIEEQYGVTHEELIGPRRNANIAKARHIAIYLAIEMCEMTTTAVGAEFGNRNHSTVSTSYKKVQKMIQEDRTVTEDLKSLRDKITLRS